ncbi:ABC transporter ATP-binding protein [Candidatus Cloacimonadota bacterium]
MNLLETIALKKSYQEVDGRLNVLNGVDMQVDSGKLVAVTGESGSGKSTLLHLLGMLDMPDSGKILYSGNEIKVSDKNIHQFRNREIGFVFQFHYLLEDFTAEENIAMPMLLATSNQTKSIKEARKLAKELGIYDRKDHYPNQLSGGEQQRVAVARALINKPKIILADEPTGNLDAKHSLELMEMIKKLNNELGQTFVLITHNLDIAADMHEHYILNNGILEKN